MNQILAEWVDMPLNKSTKAKQTYFVISHLWYKIVLEETRQIFFFFFMFFYY